MRTDADFSIKLEVDRLPDVNEAEKPGGGDANFETILTNIRRGALIGILMTGAASDKSFIHTPYQVLQWKSKKLIATFWVRAPPVDCEFTCMAQLTINEMPIGSLRSIIKAGRSLPQDPAQSSSPLTQDQDVAKVKQWYELAKTIADPIRNAFVCCEHSRWEHVVSVCQSVEAAGVRCLVDALDMNAATNVWQSNVVKWLSRVDLVIIVWSPARELTPSQAEN